MDKALDPLHSGGRRAWSNPATGQNGSVAAAGEAFVRDDQVCRSFNATLNQNKPGPAQDAARRSSRLVGVACRVGAGSWTIQKIKPIRVVAGLTSTCKRCESATESPHP